MATHAQTQTPLTPTIQPESICNDTLRSMTHFGSVAYALDLRNIDLRGVDLHALPLRGL
ncbi:MAG: hypothetical protein R3B89_28205 [Polyangiaceae bacterium]